MAEIFFFGTLLVVFRFHEQYTNEMQKLLQLIYTDFLQPQLHGSRIVPYILSIGQHIPVIGHVGPKDLKPVPTTTPVTCPSPTPKPTPSPSPKTSPTPAACPTPTPTK